MARDRSRLYVAHIVNGSVAVIDPAGPTLLGTFAVGSSPTQLQVTGDGTKLVVRISGSVTLVDTTTGTTVATFPAPFVSAIETSPTAPRAFVGTNVPSVRVIDTVADTVVADIPMPALPNHLTISPDGSRLYVVHRLSGLVSVVDTQTNTVMATVTVPLGGALRPAAVLPNNRAFVPSAGEVPSAVFVIE